MRVKEPDVIETQDKAQRGQFMSVFTNPASAAAEHAAAYVAAVLDLLGGRDAVEVLRSTPEVVGDRVRKIAPSDIFKPEAPGK